MLWVNCVADVYYFVCLVKVTLYLILFAITRLLCRMVSALVGWLSSLAMPRKNLRYAVVIGLRKITIITVQIAWAANKAIVTFLMLFMVFLLMGEGDSEGMWFYYIPCYFREKKITQNIGLLRLTISSLSVFLLLSRLSLLLRVSCLLLLLRCLLYAVYLLS